MSNLITDYKFIKDRNGEVDCAKLAHEILTAIKSMEDYSGKNLVRLTKKQDLADLVVRLRMICFDTLIILSKLAELHDKKIEDLKKEEAVDLGGNVVPVVPVVPEKKKRIVKKKEVASEERALE